MLSIYQRGTLGSISMVAVVTMYPFWISTLLVKQAKLCLSQACSRSWFAYACTSVDYLSLYGSQFKLSGYLWQQWVLMVTFEDHWKAHIDTLWSPTACLSHFQYLSVDNTVIKESPLWLGTLGAQHPNHKGNFSQRTLSVQMMLSILTAYWAVFKAL